jgi:RHS repeat-associated protein
LFASNGAWWYNGAGIHRHIPTVAIYKQVLDDDERTWLYNYGNGRNYAGVSMGTIYTYGNAAHPHAVSALTNGNAYEYDLNGNQTKRVVGTETYLLFYDAENRLSKVCKDTSNNGSCDSGEEIAKFYYDADGRRVKSIIGDETTLFIGAHYELTNPETTGQIVTKYYFAGAQRIAMRKYNVPSSMEVEYILGDHLGSTSVTTDKQGEKVSEIRYTAWGQVRYSTSTSGSLPTDYTFTGQYSDSYINLMWYGSRHYDPELGRFIQPDSIVPLAAQGVQAWDRYAYVNNSPTNYTDPSGHMRVADGPTRDRFSRAAFDKYVPLPWPCRQCHTDEFTLPPATLTATGNVHDVFYPGDPGDYQGVFYGSNSGVNQFNFNSVGGDGEALTLPPVFPSSGGNVATLSGGAVPVKYGASYELHVYDNLLIVSLHEDYFIPAYDQPLNENETFGGSALIAETSGGQQVEIGLGSLSPGNIAYGNLTHRDSAIQFWGRGNFPTQLKIQIIYGALNRGSNRVYYPLMNFTPNVSP